MSAFSLFFWLLVCALLSAGCDRLNPARSVDYGPSRLPVGALSTAVWLPAGIEEFRLDAADQRRLRELGLDRIEWLQRAVRDETTAEEAAMTFCNRSGLGMPVYYEAPGYSPYDKLHNWATRTDPGPDFGEQVRRRVRSLQTQWQGAPGFMGYLVGHEDYSRDFYPALGKTVEILRQEDPLRPAITVGYIDSYPAVDRFMDAFFAEGGAANIFQHEHYVFREGLPSQGKELQQALDELVEGYGRVARHLQGRHGRWQAIVQVHREEREGLGESGPYYRRPTPGEIRVQVGLALARGASGVVYFLYSSGVEELKDEEGQVRQRRLYEGLVDERGEPTENYFAVRALNGLLKRLSPLLENLHFHGGFSSQRWLDNELLRRADEDLEFGLFGDGERQTHLLVVNRRPAGARKVKLELAQADAEVVDALTGEALAGEGEVELSFEGGGLRLLAIGRKGTQDGETGP